MLDLVLAHDRKIAVSDALGLSFARVRALPRLTDEPLTLRALAAIRDVRPEDLAALLRHPRAAEGSLTGRSGHG